MAATDPGRGTAWDVTQGYFSTLVTDLYLPFMADAKNNACALLSMIPEASERVSGKYLFMPVKYGRNTDAMSAIYEGGKLPDPTAAKARPYMFRPRISMFRAIITGDIMRQAAMEPVRYVEALQDVMDQGYDDMAVEVNRQLQNDGSGRLAELSAVTGGGLTTGQADLRLNSSIESVATCTSSPAQFLGGEYHGQRVAIVSPAGVVRGIRTVGSNSVAGVVSETVGPPSAARVTFCDALTGAAVALPAGSAIGDWVTRCSRVGVADGSETAPNTAFRVELPGLAGIFSDSFVLDGNGVAVLPAGAMNYVGQEERTAVSGATVGFQGAPVTELWNQAIVSADPGGVLRDPTEELLEIAIARARETNNAEIDFFLSGYGEQIAFGLTMLPDKKYTNTTQLSGGWTALDMKGKPWAVDRHCYKNRIYGMGLKSGGFRQYVRTPFQPLDPLGPQWYRMQDDDKYQGAWVMEGTHGVDIRQRCGFVLTDIRRAG